MAQYKCVPAPKDILISKKQTVENACSLFADLINKEAVDGWKFHSMETITVTEPVGCIAALFGQKDTTTYYNMLTFVRE